MAGTEKKRWNKAEIANFILRKRKTSKQEIAVELGISMPTVLQNVKELIEDDIVVENGEYESTGGRKAKALSINGKRKYALGIDITKNHISYVLIDLAGSLIKKERKRKSFENITDYYESIGNELEAFIDASRISRKKILGVGISIPGIIDTEKEMLVQSHALEVQQVSFKRIQSFISYPVCFDNDANSAAYAELNHEVENTIYLSLSNTVGGSIYMNRTIYAGDHYKSAEFGHMIIERNGKRCYCGKEGCVDAYCSAKVLSSLTDDNLEQFFEKLNQGDAECLTVWDEYLEYLAITITNLRMAFDCNIVLGGYVGRFLTEYMNDLRTKLQQYNRFERDTTYVIPCEYNFEASGIGIALHFVEEFMEETR